MADKHAVIREDLQTADRVTAACKGDDGVALFSRDDVRTLLADHDRLCAALLREADWHEGEAKASHLLSKSSTGVYHGLKAEWHKERSQIIRAALAQEQS